MDNGTNPNNYPMNNMSDKKEHGERIDMPPGNFPIRRASNLSNTLRRSMRSILPNVDDKKNKKTSDEDKKWVKWIHDRLPPNSTPNDPIPEAAFIKLLAASSLSPSVVFIKRLFNIWDKKYGRKTYLTVMELETELVGISNLDPLGKLRLLWLIYDDDESGELSKDEFASILQCCVDDNSLELSEYQRDVLIETLFRDIDTDADEQISFQEFENWIEAHPEFNKKFVLSASKFFKPPDAKAVAKKKKKGCSWPTVLTRKFIQNHRSEVCWTLFAVLIFIVCFLYGSLDAAFNMKYRHGEHKITSDKCFPFYSVAHGFGFNLNVWPVVLCLLMCRRILSAIRNSRLGFFMPVDHAVHAHKILGWWPTTICVFGHFIMHMFHFNCLSGGDQATYIDLLFTTKPGLGYFGALSITGWILLFSHIIMFIGAHPAVRRRGNFEFFFWTHLLYLVYYVVLIIHSWKFWYFFIIPGILFIIEKFLGSKFWQTQSVGDFYIEDVMIWPSGVGNSVLFVTIR